LTSFEIVESVTGGTGLVAPKGLRRSPGCGLGAQSAHPALQNVNVGKISDSNAAIGAAIAKRLGGVRVLVSGRKGRRWVYLALGD
jgi:hypothetical protein